MGSLVLVGLCLFSVCGIWFITSQFNYIKSYEVICSKHDWIGSAQNLNFANDLRLQHARQACKIRIKTIYIIRNN